ncbi:MAG: hypothetical protein R3B40_17290 [Polyangiales bacterium]
MGKRPAASGSQPAEPTPPPSLEVRVAWASCVWFVLVGLALALAGRTRAFAPWREAAADVLFGTPTFPAALEPFAALTDVIIGGSIVGKWVAAAWLVAHPLRAGERWAHRALVAGLVWWFAWDSGVSLAVGATFNVWMINLLPFISFGALLAWAHRRGTHDAARVVRPPHAPITASWRALTLVCWLFVAVGVALSLGSTSLLFGVYQRAVAEAWFEGALTVEALTWMRFSYGIIGATFGAHFLMLALALHGAPGQRWVLTAVATSMLAWFVVDATGSALHGAWFNVWWVDAPSLAAVAIPWALARRETRARWSATP